MIVISRMAYDEEAKNQIIEDVQSVIYNPRSMIFQIESPKISAFITRESLGNFAIYDHWPEVLSKASGKMTIEEAVKRLKIWLKCSECPDSKPCYDSYLVSLCDYNDIRENVSMFEAVETIVKFFEGGQNDSNL